MTMSRKCVLLLLVLASASRVFGGATVFPVRDSSNHRYLEDQNGVPFPIMGRTAWFVTSLSVGEYEMFINDTAMRGYDAIEFHVINHDPRGHNPPYGGNGAIPFLDRLDGTAWNGSLSYGDINRDAPDLTTPNETYWSFVDGLLSYCEAHGILVFIFPAYVGWLGGEQGWMREIVSNGSDRMRTYGAWIANRYRNQKNLVWMMGGDMGTPPNTFSAEQTAAEAGLLDGLRSVTGQQSIFFTAEWNTESIAVDQSDFGIAMTLNGAYSHSGDVNTQGRRAYAYNPSEPSFLLEGPYDQEGPDGNDWNPNATQPIRRFQWWSWLSTIGGYIVGNGFVWPFNAPDWQNHLDTQCSRDMTRLNSFMISIAWHKLVPSGLSGMRDLITDGGSFVGSGQYVSAAASFDGALLVAYIPPDHSGSITVDMTAMNGPSHARWFDPSDGVYVEIGNDLPNTGTRVFNPIGNNSVGEGDWTLVLEGATGTQTPTPTPAATSTPTPTVSATPTPTLTPVPAAQALNLSTRMEIRDGDNVGIGGFVISGSGSKHVLIRAIGPSLAPLGIPNPLVDPVLELHGPGSFVTITNDNWRDSQEATIIADGIPPTDDLEAAIDVNLDAGAYTAVVSGKDGGVGVGLVEIYDLSPTAAPDLLNISTRAFVNSGNNIVIAGFILGVQNGNARIIVRGIGPSLAAFGVPDALGDPTLELRNGNGVVLVSNNNWEDNPSQAAELIAADLAPANSLESAIAATLPPGAYTALLAGHGSGAGVGLVEVYERRDGP